MTSDKGHVRITQLLCLQFFCVLVCFHVSAVWLQFLPSGFLMNEVFCFY